MISLGGYVGFKGYKYAGTDYSEKWNYSIFGARAAWQAPVALEGPDALVAGLGGVAVARDGTGAVVVLRHARTRPTRDGEWVRGLLARKPTKVAAVALANKTARIVWAVMVRGDGYRAKAVLGAAA